MVRTLVRRLVATVLLGAVAVGGGGMPVLDALVFHGPSRVAEAFRPHYEASSTCHGDGCSVRALAQSRFDTDRPVFELTAVAVHTVADIPLGASTAPLITAHRYLSRAPPLSV
jgi:hypothetical protein